MLVSLTSIAVPNDEEVRHREDNTNAFVNEDNTLGNGSLVISKNSVLWIKDNGQGFSLQYPMISLHAISRDLTNFNSECLYLMVEDPNNSDTESANDDNEARSLEIRFVPQNKTQLEVMFKSMSECQALHPDPNDSVSSEEDDELEDEDDVYEDAEEAGDGTQMRGNVYDVAAAEDALGLPSNPSDNNFSNGDSEEAMEVMGQFDDAEPDH